MKKTITTAVLALGLAASASATTLNDAILRLPNYNGKTTTFTTADTVNNVDFSTLNGTRAEFTMILVLDWDAVKTSFTSGTAADINLVSFTDASVTSNNSLSTGVGLSFDGAATPTFKATTWYGDSARPNKTGSLEAYVSPSGQLALTLRHNSNGTRMIPGTQADAYWTDGGLKWTDAAFDTMVINSALAGAIDHIYVFNSSVADADIVSLTTQLVPEPTTATLSLLALAGLAARRRRK